VSIPGLAVCGLPAPAGLFCFLLGARELRFGVLQGFSGLLQSARGLRDISRGARGLEFGMSGALIGVPDGAFGGVALGLRVRGLLTGR
jgi:hypothetical protein